MLILFNLTQNETSMSRTGIKFQLELTISVVREFIGDASSYQLSTEEGQLGQALASGLNGD
jgi:hypothetical protein